MVIDNNRLPSEEYEDAWHENIRLRARIAALEAELATARKAITYAREEEFFHDGLCADLAELEVKDEAHAYVLGWQHAVEMIDAALGKGDSHGN